MSPLSSPVPWLHVCSCATPPHVPPCSAARDLLTPGGLLLFRDYGENDMVMLRFHGSQWLSDRLYRRSDGTLAYFFRESGASMTDTEVRCLLRLLAFFQGSLFLFREPDDSRSALRAEVAELMREAGFEVEECEYHCVENVNRKKGKVLRRIFVHAVGRKVRG